MNLDDSTNERTMTRGGMLRGMAAAAAVAGTAPLLGAAPSGPLAEIARLLKVEPKYAGKGLNIDLGGVFPLTGQGAIFGNKFQDVPNLAFKHIAAMGGPTFNLVMKDNKSGDPQAGVDAVRELGSAHVGMELSSFAGDLGAMIPGIKQYKILSLDGSGGTSVFAQNKPYYYGSIAITPNDAIPGLIKYLKTKMPTAKRIAFVGWDLGSLSDQVAKSMTKYLQAGTTLVADERTAVGETDYGASLQKVKAASPDIVFLAVYTEDVGYFMKQYVTSGINKPVVAFTHTDAALKIAGPAYDGLYFSFDYFDAERPRNPWAKYFVEEFKSIESGTLPDYYSANTYEDVFTFWQCVMRTLKAGGNPKDGTALDKALRSDPAFPSIYGGSDTAAGTIAFDLQTHSVKSRPMAVLQYKSGKVNPLAYFNIGGDGFRLA